MGALAIACVCPSPPAPVSVATGPGVAVPAAAPLVPALAQHPEPTDDRDQPDSMSHLDGPDGPVGQGTTVIREYPRASVAATFEVGPTSALVWAYAPESTEARIEVEYAGLFEAGQSRRYERVSTYAISLTPATGNTAVRCIDGLSNDSAYRYRLQFGNGDGTDWYYFRTAPAADADAAVHFVFGAEISNDPKFASPILGTMSRSGAAFLLSLGDWPYTDLPVRDTTLDQYRASHRLARLQPDVQELARVMSIYAIYDDHEVHNDWNAVFVDQRPKRALAGLRAWDEFFPVRERAEDPLTTRRYRTFHWGMHAQFFILDARRYRSPHSDPNSPQKTMLGREQWDWLLHDLRASRATFKIIVTSVPMDYGTTREHWNAYPDERDALYAFIADERISGVVFLTGDQHWMAVHALPSGHREYQVGPLRSFLRKPPNPPPAGVIMQSARPNYGEIVITPGPVPMLVFTGRDEHGALLHADVIRPVRGQRPTPAPASKRSGRPAP